MRMFGGRSVQGALMLFVAILMPQARAEGGSQASQSRVQAALENVAALARPGQDGLATIWDGNKYVQCRRMPDRALRCEAGGSLMQPSLVRVLTSERVAKLAAQGWSLDPSFGSYVRLFPADAPASQVAEKLIQALTEGYDADIGNLEIRTDWIKSQPCPPRNGPTQNLAGSIADPPPIAKFSLYAGSLKLKIKTEKEL